MQTTRRTFLKHGLSGVTLLAGGVSLPGFLTRTARAAWLGEQLAAGGKVGPDGRILVVVQLSGGNDGLNMVVPYADPAYHRARPTLRVAEDAALRLDDHLGLHPEMTGLKALYDDGALAVINNVGYPNPDRSHFRSMDIWHAADPAVDQVETGWLGRVADLAAPKDGPPSASDSTTATGDRSDSQAPIALHLDSDALPAALRARTRPTPSIRDISAVRLRTDDQTLADTLAAPRPGASDDLLFVQRVAVAACANARRIEQIADRPAQQSPYPGYGLAQRLQQIAQLIGADFGPRIYYTSLGGFDTHARQLIAHGPLLRELSDSVAAFMADLRLRGLADRVTLMTFSEFGRRVAENGSQGTDHGAAAPMFLAGAGVQPGLHGGRPDLTQLLEGDLRHSVDFRGVYAAVLDKVLGVNPATVLGGTFEAPRLIA